MLKKWITGGSNQQPQSSAAHASGTGSGDSIINGSGHVGTQYVDGSGSALTSAEDGGADAKQFGMENFGNTCYVNSVLQALYFCQPFRELICLTPDPHATTPSGVHPPVPQLVRSDSPSSTPPLHKDERPSRGHPQTTAQPPPTPASIPSTLFSALRSLYLHISSHPQMKGTVQPTSFITKLKKENELFRSSMHQDAHEFLNYLLNKIVEDLEGNVQGREDLSRSIASTRTSNESNNVARPPHPRTLVQTLFEGALTNETRCLTCEIVSSRDEAFLDLSIDIERNSSVTSCLKQFSASEMLCEKNKFFCDSCCGLQEAEKRMKIKRLPNVLALHLKRFKHNWDEDKYVKLGYRVAFPLELRLFNTVDDAEDPDRLYELFSFVVHIGGGPHHGHYIAIVKSYGGVWRVFDDDNVSTIQESDIPKYFGDTSTAAGYVLFYQAVDMDSEAIGLPRKPARIPAIGFSDALRSTFSAPTESRASFSAQSVSGPDTSTTPHLNPHESSASSRVSGEIQPRSPSPHKLHKSAPRVTKPPESSVASSTLLSSSQSLTPSFFRKKERPSPTRAELAPAKLTLHKEPSMLFSQIAPHSSTNEKEKDNHRTSWFRTKRKDSLSTGSTTTLLTAAPSVDHPTASPSPPVSYSPTGLQRRRTSTDLPRIHTSVRPRTAPESPQSSPKRSSIINPNIPPVPPLPSNLYSFAPQPTTTPSTVHPAPPPSPNQGQTGHKRHSSLTRPSISAFLNARTAGGSPTVDDGLFTSGPPSTSPLNVTLETPISHHRSPRRTISAHPLSPARPLSTGDPSSSESSFGTVNPPRPMMNGRPPSSSRPASAVGDSFALPLSVPEKPLADSAVHRSSPLQTSEARSVSPLIENENENGVTTTTTTTTTTTKRPSRKMSLTGHLGIFGGWGSSSRDKEKERRGHGVNGKDHSHGSHAYPPLVGEKEGLRKGEREKESEKAHREKTTISSGGGPSSRHVPNGMVDFMSSLRFSG